MNRFLIYGNAVAKLGINLAWNSGRTTIGSTILNSRIQLLSGKKPVIRNFTSQPVRVLDTNTNVVKDVILFKYENPKQFRYINFFALGQFIFWNYLSFFALNELRNTPVDEENKENLAFWERVNLGENKWRYGMSAACFLIGYGILVTAWFFILRSVRFLVLRKGGKSVSFVTYTPFGQNRIMDVPLKCISAQESRQTAKSTIAIKVKNRSFYYVLDMRGEFKNPVLFDHTVGLKRRNVS